MGDATTTGLTRNQSLVLETLDQAGGPLSAYKILDQLRCEGLRAPLQVYRALDKLIALGRVHRLESLNAFVACRHPGCDGHETMVFAICDVCGHVSEMTSDGLVDHLAGMASTARFALRKSTIELRGLCAACAANA